MVKSFDSNAQVINTEYVALEIFDFSAYNLKLNNWTAVKQPAFMTAWMILIVSFYFVVLPLVLKFIIQFWFEYFEMKLFAGILATGVLSCEEKISFCNAKTGFRISGDFH